MRAIGVETSLQREFLDLVSIQPIAQDGEKGQPIQRRRGNREADDNAGNVSRARRRPSHTRQRQEHRKHEAARGETRLLYEDEEAENHALAALAGSLLVELDRIRYHRAGEKSGPRVE